MNEIVIASANAKLLSSLETLIEVAYNQKPVVCKNSVELAAVIRERESAVLLLGPLKDKPSIAVARSMPSEWEVVLFLSSNSPFPYYVSNITPINLPVNKKEILQTVSELMESSSQTFGSKTTSKKQRSDEDKLIIEQAKKAIMSERSLSEGDAHKLLQRYSMNLGITMVESAKRFLKNS